MCACDGKGISILKSNKNRVGTKSRNVLLRGVLELLLYGIAQVNSVPLIRLIHVSNLHHTATLGDERCSSSGEDLGNGHCEDKEVLESN